MTTAHDLFSLPVLQILPSPGPFEARRCRITDAFGAAQGLLILVLEEEYRLRGGGRTNGWASAPLAGFSRPPMGVSRPFCVPGCADTWASFAAPG